MSPKLRRRLIVLAVLHLGAALLGVCASLWLSRELPGIGDLSLLRMPQMTVLLDRRGERLYSFAEQRRTPVTLDQISPNFVNAILATEDPRFEQHIGVDLKAISRALWATVVSMRWGVQGGSTITQQLARDQFLYPRKTIRRKLQEMILALTIEKQYTKREILELYLNRIYFGHGRYGVEAAAQFFFNKRARDLTLPEAALLAGLPQRPEGYSPIKFPKRALARRSHVLDRMVEEKFIARDVARAASATTLGVTRGGGGGVQASYFVEEVRRLLLRRFGEETLYRSGLLVRTTLDPTLQRAAERAVRAGLDEYGRRHQRVPDGRPLTEGQSPADYNDPQWNGPIEPGDIVPALVEDVRPDGARVRIGENRLTLDRAGLEWTGRRILEGVLKVGRLHLVKVLLVDSQGRPAKIELASDSAAQAALIALDPATGDVLALVGGKDFERSEFDRAMQAERQAGSAFKPFIYAAALERGLAPTQLIWDRPTVLLDAGSPAPYQPENYEGDYEGLVTLQHALEHSRNLPTVRLLDALGYDPAVEMGQRLGLRTELRPYPSLALGAFEVRLSDITAAYGSFINGGVLVAPRLVQSVHSADGQELWAPSPETREVLAPEIAATMVAMLEGTTTRGTAARAASLGRPTMGKTGTTDDFTDAWFIGGTPRIVAGAWIGFDQRQGLGRGEAGAQAALPIWMQFIDEGLAGQPAEEFPRPPGLTQVLIDLETGKRAVPEIGCQKLVLETAPETQPPPGLCSSRDHIRARFPYPLQSFPIRADGALIIPPVEAARFAARAPQRFQVAGGGRELRYAWGDKVGVAALAWGSAEWSAYTRELARATTMTDEDSAGGRFKGLDGWPADVVEVNRTGQLRPIETPVDP